MLLIAENISRLGAPKNIYAPLNLSERTIRGLRRRKIS